MRKTVFAERVQAVCGSGDGLVEIQLKGRWHRKNGVWKSTKRIRRSAADLEFDKDVDEAGIFANDEPDSYMFNRSRDIIEKNLSLCRAKGWSDTDIARRAAIDRKTLANAKTGSTEFRLLQAIGFARAVFDLSNHDANSPGDVNQVEERAGRERNENKAIVKFLTEIGYSAQLRYSSKANRATDSLLSKTPIKAGYVVYEPFVIPPLGAADSAEPTGLAVDPFVLLSKLVGFQIVWIPLTWSTMIKRLQDGKVDVIVTFAFQSMRRLVLTRLVPFVPHLTMGMNAVCTREVQLLLQSLHSVETKFQLNDLAKPEFKDIPLYVARRGTAHEYLNVVLGDSAEHRITAEEGVSGETILAKAVGNNGIGFTDDFTCRRFCNQSSNSGEDCSILFDHIKGGLFKIEGGLLCRSDDEWAEILTKGFHLMARTHGQLYKNALSKYWSAELLESFGNLERQKIEHWYRSLDHYDDYSGRTPVGKTQTRKKRSVQRFRE